MEITPELPGVLIVPSELPESAPQDLIDLNEEEVEMPDLEPIVQRFLGRSASQESDQPSEVSTTESVLRTLHRVNLICLNPIDLMVVPVSLGDSEQIFSALVDSGAEVNLLSSAVVSDLHLEPRSTNIDLKGFGVSPHSTVGEVTLTPVIHGMSFPSVTFHVVPSGTVTEPVVLGHPFLEANRVLVDNARNRLCVTDPNEDSFWEYYVADKDQNCHQVVYGVNVVATGTTSLSDSEAHCTPVAIRFPSGLNPDFVCPHCDANNRPEYFYDGQIVTQGLADRASGISGIMSVSDPCVLVKSLSTGPVSVKKGDVLGKLYTLLCVEPPPSCFSITKVDTGATDPTVAAISEIALAADVQPEQKLAFQEMMLEHLPVISTSDEDVGQCSSTPIRIKLYDETPIYQRPRRFSPPITEGIERQCKELNALGIIEPSISPWSSPVVAIVKPD